MAAFASFTNLTFPLFARSSQFSQADSRGAGQDALQGDQCAGLSARSLLGQSPGDRHRAHQYVIYSYIGLRAANSVSSDGDSYKPRRRRLTPHPVEEPQHLDPNRHQVDIAVVATSTWPSMAVIGDNSTSASR